jgi:Ca2+-binding EF-hand superfamily protein
MLRTITKKGLNLDDYLRSLDRERKGLLHRKQFYSILKRIGLPFSSKELQDIVHHYSHQSSPNNQSTNQSNNGSTSNNSDFVDYLLFLKDARLLKKSTGGPNAANNNSKQHYDFQEEKLGSYMSILHDVRRMLLDAIRSLGKHPDDIYRTFARWDTQGTGTVTATQFLRVLARLHIELSDQDQDFLVELLDTNAMGRIDFESLLAFCFASLDPDLLQSPNGIIVGTAIGFDDAAGETLSAVSLENNSLDMRSTNSGHGGGFNNKRPQTASISRPYGGGSNGARHALDAGSKVISGIESSIGDDPFGGKSSSMVLPATNNVPVVRNRPMTASARVTGGSNGLNKRTGSHQSMTAVRNKEMEDGILVEDLPDDVIHGEEDFLKSTRDKPDDPSPQPPDDNMGIPSAFGLLSGRPLQDRTQDPHNYEFPIDPANYARMFPGIPKQICTLFSYFLT